MKKVVLFWVSCLVFLGMVGSVWASNNSKVKIYNSQGKLIKVYSSKKQPRQVELVSDILGDAGGKAERKDNFLFKRPRHAKLKATYVLCKMESVQKLRFTATVKRLSKSSCWR